MQHHDIEKLLPLYYEGTLSTEDERRVEEWINRSAANKAVATDMAVIYCSMDRLQVCRHVDAEAALMRVNGKLRKRRLYVLLKMAERVAAILFVPLLLVALLWLYNGTHDANLSYVRYATPSGSTATVTLSDGTVVTLNADTKLSYPDRFGTDERKVILEGEAYFSVAKDAVRPFIVATSSDAFVKVYGTRFNVECDAVRKEVVATLEEGSIAMGYMDKRKHWKEQVIVPGERISYSARRHQVSVCKVAVDVVTSWKDNRLVFRDTPVEEVLQALSKRYGVSFEVSNAAIYKNSFTGILENQSMQHVLEILEMSSDMHFKKDKSQRKYIVY